MKIKGFMANQLKGYAAEGFVKSIGISFFLFLVTFSFGYHHVLRQLDNGIVASGMVMLVWFTLMRTGKVTGHYRNDYSSLKEVIIVYFVLFWSSIVRLPLIYALEYFYLKDPADKLDSLIPLWRLDGVAMLTFILAMVLFYKMFFTMPYVGVYKYHKEGPPVINRRTKVEFESAIFTGNRTIMEDRPDDFMVDKLNTRRRSR